MSAQRPGAARLRAELDAMAREQAERTRKNLERLRDSKTGAAVRALVRATEDPGDAIAGFLADLLEERKGKRE